MFWLFAVLGICCDFNIKIVFFEIFCEDVPRSKLCASINFVFFGPTDQKLWVFEVFR
jgi:hypothetical protein